MPGPLAIGGPAARVHHAVSRCIGGVRGRPPRRAVVEGRGGRARQRLHPGSRGLGLGLAGLGLGLGDARVILVPQHRLRLLEGLHLRLELDRVLGHRDRKLRVKGVVGIHGDPPLALVRAPGQVLDRQGRARRRRREVGRRIEIVFRDAEPRDTNSGLLRRQRAERHEHAHGARHRREAVAGQGLVVPGLRGVAT